MERRCGGRVSSKYSLGCWHLHSTIVGGASCPQATVYRYMGCGRIHGALRRCGKPDGAHTNGAWSYTHARINAFSTMASLNRWIIYPKVNIIIIIFNKYYNITPIVILKLIFIQRKRCSQVSFKIKRILRMKNEFFHTVSMNQSVHE